MRVIPPPFFSCVKRCFFLHKSCVKLPIIKEHLLTHLPKTQYETDCNNFNLPEKDKHHDSSAYQRLDAYPDI